jgi:hypothetical protein
VTATDVLIDVLIFEDYGNRDLVLEENMELLSGTFNGGRNGPT